MEQSILKAISSIHNRLDNAELRGILLQFYKDRTMEILEHLEETGAGKMLDLEHFKVGGTSND